MHAAIDLDQKQTLLAAWQEGQPMDHPSLTVRLPGLAAFEPAAGADAWSRSRLQDYLAFIHREYLLPTRLTIDSAAIAIPGVPDLMLRRRILDILEETLGLEEALVVPRALARAAGFQLNSPRPLGDIMLLEQQGNALEASFLSTYPGNAITLEGQCRGDARVIRDEAARLGFLTPGGWNLDHLYLSGDAGPGTPMGQLAAGIPQRIPVRCADDLPLAPVQGLYPYMSANPLALRLIYPYEFYWAVTGPGGQIDGLNRIPFDFSHLELDCDSRYKLARLTDIDISDGGGEQERINVRIIEYSSRSRSQPPFTALDAPVLEIDCLRQDLPRNADLVLDMGAATLHLDLPSPRDEGEYLARDGFWDLYHRDIDRFIQTAQPRPHSTLTPPSPPTGESPPSALERQIGHILARIRFLLDQWDDSRCADISE